MSDLLRVGTSGLLAYQRALTTTSHNVSNAGVDGYSRQRVELSAQVTGSPFGAGVRVVGVERLEDVYANNRLIEDGAGLAANARLADFATRVDTLLSDSNSGLSGSINAFFQAAQDVSASPNSLAAREVLLGSARDLTTRATTLNSQLARLDNEIDQRAIATVAEANEILESLARVNRDIAASAGPANDLRDERDRLTRQLSEKIGINTTLQDGDQLNVYTRDGHALLLGADVRPLALREDPERGSRLQLTVGQGPGAIPLPTPTNGELGGLFSARTQVIDPTRERLGALTANLARAVNDVQTAATDLNGQPGQPLFELGNPVAVPNANNDGTATVDVSFGADGKVPDSALTLRFSSGSWQLQSQQGGTLALTGSGTPGDPFRAGALSIIVSGTPSDGDRFSLKSASDAVAGMQLNNIGARGIAAAGALSPSLPPTNTGDFSVRSVESVDPNNPGARTAASIEFLGPNSYQIDGGPVQGLNPDGVITGAGWQLTLEGSPSAGDRIELTPTGTDSGSNAGARALAALAESPVTASGDTPSGGYAELVAAGGVTARQAESARDAFQRLQTADLAAREATSGVNLDEEAANLLRLQQAYQASARIIATADELFQTLLGAVRR
ncbi:flagellar hook-associated protein FlgK [Algiphilus sp.]|uniref:flagellar hook-associated protein FlgK n=1 Tax=Algiphilus sp. TaxID=1872431 RepID=UPI003B520165